MAARTRTELLTVDTIDALRDLHVATMDEGTIVHVRARPSIPPAGIAPPAPGPNTITIPPVERPSRFRLDLKNSVRSTAPLSDDGSRCIFPRVGSPASGAPGAFWIVDGEVPFCELDLSVSPIVCVAQLGVSYVERTGVGTMVTTLEAGVYLGGLAIGGNAAGYTANITAHTPFTLIAPLVADISVDAYAINQSQYRIATFVGGVATDMAVTIQLCARRY